MKRSLLLAWVVTCALLPIAAARATRGGEIQAAATDAVDPQVFAARRQRLMEQIGLDRVVVLFAAPTVERNHDVDFPYRQGSDSWYLTGFPEPGSAAVIEKRGKQLHTTLFVPEADPSHELWNGRRLGLDGAKPLADEVVGASTLAHELKKRLKGRKQVAAQFSGDEERRQLLTESVDKGTAIDERELRAAVGRLRLVKGPEELALLQRAIDDTCAALGNAMRYAEPGVHEYEIQAVIEYTYLLRGAPRIGFPSIVGSGRNSVILHYDTNRELVPKDRTIVCDVGAEFGMYSADVTRTLPSNGRFTPEQAVIYAAVLAAQKAGIAVARPGSTLDAIREAALATLGAELVRAGVVDSPQAARELCPHGVSHWLGLDVHDQCPYDGGEGKRRLELAPGMVTTIEPGCYIKAGAEGIDPKWWEIGVRIEDDILITEEGCIVMSARAPREIAEVEAMMAEPNPFPRCR